MIHLVYVADNGSLISTVVLVLIAVHHCWAN